MSRPILAPRRPTAMVGVSTASSWPSDDDLMECPVPGPDPDPEIRENLKNRFPPVLLYYGRTRAPTDMVGVPTDQA